MPDTKILNFPDSRQGHDFSCGDAATQAVLYYYGIEKREDVLIEEMKTNPDLGTDIGAIVKYLNKHDLRAEYRKGMTVQDLRDNVDKGWPTILMIQAWFDEYPPDLKTLAGLDNGHYVVVIGYLPGMFVFDDPSLLSNRGFIPVEELEQRWHGVTDDGEWGDHFGIVVKGKPAFDGQQMLKIEMLRTAREHPVLQRYLVSLARALGR